IHLQVTFVTQHQKSDKYGFLIFSRQLAQKIIRVNSGAVSVRPKDADGVPSDGLHALDVDVRRDRLRIEQRRARMFIDAQGARALAAEVTDIEHRTRAVVPREAELAFLRPENFHGLNHFASTGMSFQRRLKLCITSALSDSSVATARTTFSATSANTFADSLFG